MAFLVSTDPANLPLTVAEARDHLDVESGDRDDYLEGLVSAAAKTVERWEWRALITQTIVLTLDNFPRVVIALPRPRLQSVTTIKYVDENGEQQTLDSSLYQVDATSEPGRVRPAYGYVWPTTRSDTLAAVEITYQAGYGDDHSAIPSDTKHLLKLLLSHFFNNPSAVSDVRVQDLPVGIDALMRPCHDGSLMEFV